MRICNKNIKASEWWAAFVSYYKTFQDYTHTCIYICAYIIYRKNNVITIGETYIGKRLTHIYDWQTYSNQKHYYYNKGNWSIYFKIIFFNLMFPLDYLGFSCSNVRKPFYYGWPHNLQYEQNQNSSHREISGGRDLRDYFSF